MKLSEAREIINYCVNRSYKDMTRYYRYGEIMCAIRTIEKTKSSTHDDNKQADIVYWKIALRPS